MNLVDTGPLVALVDEAQEYHTVCIETARQFKSPMITTLPCFTEALYFLKRLRGWTGQQALWRFWETRLLLIHDTNPAEYQRMRILMEQYKDTPMDFADASLVTAAEQLELKRIFTLDSDFYVYRINGKTAFDVIP